MLRLFTPHSLKEGTLVSLEEKAFHHAIHVLRLKKSDTLHLFNERDGEWQGTLVDVSKKEATLLLHHQLRAPSPTQPLHLYFAPLKPDRQHFLIEKSTELGVSDFFPVHTEFTQVGKANLEKWQDQALHATQQCERLDVPTFFPMKKLQDILNGLGTEKIIACLERSNHVYSLTESKKLLQNAHKILIGPEGGWSPSEMAILSDHPQVMPISLGENILRAETAALSMLSILRFLKNT